MPNQVNIINIQYSAGLDKQANLGILNAYITDCCRTQYVEGIPNIICLPEVFNFYSFTIQDSVDRHAAALNNAEVIESGQTVTWASELAQQLNIYIIGGSILEINPDNTNKPFNTCFVVNPKGELIAKYRKINLFGIKANKKNNTNDIEIIESKYRSYGHELCLIDIEGVKIGIAICFDLRFPEIFMAYCSMNADIVVLPAAFLHATGQYHWEVLCRARAIENQMFFVGSNQGANANCFGHSLIVNPWGEILNKLNTENLGHIAQTLDITSIDNIRRHIPMERNTRLRRITDI